MDFFQRMGQRVNAEWRKKSFDERAFPEIARAALEASPPSMGADYMHVLDAWLFDESLPLNRSGQSFGEPSITVHATERFQIDVLCWMNSTTAIHQHGFSGAFHVMRGSSIHSRYRFTERVRIDSQMRLGDLAFEASELLPQGSTRVILAGSGLIHALFHLDRPSISIVVRTSDERDVTPQWSFEGGALAVDPFHPESTRRRRITQALDMLLVTDRAGYDRLIDRLVLEGDPSALYAALAHMVLKANQAPYRVEHERIDAIHAALRPRLGAVADGLVAVAHEGIRAGNLMTLRDDVTERHLRFFLALLMNVPTQPVVLRLIQQEHREEPRALVMRWLRELTHVESPTSVRLLGIHLDLSEPIAGIPLDELLHGCILYMMDGATGSELARKLAAEHPAADVEELEENVPDLEDVLRSGALRPLFVGAGQRDGSDRAAG